jgi:hypothetical protein
MNDIIYARVPPELKRDVHQYAESSGVSLNSAVAELLELGLGAAASAERVEALERETMAGGAALKELRLELAGEREQREAMAAAVNGLSHRLGQTIGVCPNCRGELSGQDLVVNGTCASCRHPLSSLLGEDRDKLRQTDYVVLIGAIGLLLALALWQSRQQGA